MARATLGKLPQRYSLLINGYPDERLSRCPTCHKLTQARKFPLLILINHFGPIVLGKTCRYCSKCELIMVHQHEIEAELAHAFEWRAPQFLNNEYVIIGTVEKRLWRAGLDSAPGPERPTIEDLAAHTADFKKHYDLHVDPGGGRRA